MYPILKRDHDREDEGRVETQGQRASEDKVNDDKQKEKLVSPPTEKELEELKQEYIVQCTKMIPQTYKDKGVRFWLICNLCEQYLETVTAARGHIEGMKHVEKKILKKFNEDLKLVGSPNEDRFDAITVILQQVYDEWSAEACGQQIIREKIVSDFEEFVQSIKGCKSVVVELFGSTYTGFALKDSDINMNLRFRDHIINSSPTYDTLINGILNRLTTISDSNGDVLYTNLRTNNLYSFVSHFTFTHRPSGLSCHVRYGSHHRMPICTGKLLQCYGAVDHRVKVLAVVLKYWAKLCQLDIQELGSYPSQMFVLMLVHFLQHRSPPLLPVPPKPNDFSETQQCLEHFDEYLSGLDHMIKSWKVSNTESLGMLWLGMLRYYSTEVNFERQVIQVTQSDVLLKQNISSWSSYKLLVVLSPVNPVCNISRACSSRKMYLYFEACLKATWIYFGRAVLNKLSKTLPTKGCNNPQGATSHDPCITKGNIAKPPRHVTYLTDVASQLSDFTDDPVAQSKTNEPIRSENDYDSEQHNDTHLVVEDNEGMEAAQFEFSSSNFTTKKLPEVCSLCKQEDHIFTSPNCPSTKKEKIKLANHPPLGPMKLKELDRVFVDLKVNICLKPTEIMLRRDICNIVEYYIKAIYPDVELTVFGSSANGFGKADSDIDINMKLPGNFEHDDNVKVIENVAHHLRTTPQQDWWINSVQAVTSARVPLVKMTLTERWNSLECDISLGNSLALHNTELLASYASIDERVQVMGYVLKKFAKSCNMCDASTGSLSSYAYILLLLHYLQQVKPPVIPVLQQIGGGGSVDVDGWNCWFYRFSDLPQLAKVWPHKGKNKKTVGELLINFFKYYLKEFDWQKHVVCIRQLKPLSKLGKEWAPKQVCIEDPFNLDHNLSNHLNSKMWSYICNAFRCAHDHISSPQLHSQPLTIKTVLSVEIDKKVPQDGLCYTCGKRGHGYYNCPSGRHNNTCDLCGNQGHVKSQCPMSLKAIGYPPRYSDLFPPRPLAIPPPRTTTQPFLLPNPHMPSRYPIHPYAPHYRFNQIPNQHIMPASPVRFTPKPHGLDSSRTANQQEGNRGTTPQMHPSSAYYHDRQMH